MGSGVAGQLQRRGKRSDESVGRDCQRPSSAFAAMLRRLRERDESALSYALFLVPLGIIIARVLLSATAFGPQIGQHLPASQVRWAVYGALVMREILFGRYDKRACAALMLFTGMGAIAWHANVFAYVDVLVFAFAARNLRFRTIAKFVFAELLVLAAAVYLCAGLSIIPDILFTSDTPRPPRHALGFSHPNGAAACVLFLLIIWAYLRGDRYGAIDAGVSLVALFAIFRLTDSRSVVLAFLLFALLFLILRLGPGKLRSPAFLKVAGPCAFIGIVSLGVALCIGYDPASAWMQQLDSLVSGRLSLAHSALAEYGMPLFGQDVTLGKGSRYDYAAHVWVQATAAPIVDCAYIQILIRCGPLFFLAAIGVVLNAIAYNARQADWMLVIIAIVLAAYGLMEAVSASLSRDVFLLLLAVPFGMREHA